MLTFVPPAFSYMFEMALRTSKFTESIRRSYVFFCVICLCHSCSLVRDVFNNGSSGLPEALKPRGDLFAMVLDQSMFQESIRSCPAFSVRDVFVIHVHWYGNNSSTPCVAFLRYHNSLQSKIFFF